MGKMGKLTYWVEASHGGIFEYATQHARALAAEGLHIQFLCRKGVAPDLPDEIAVFDGLPSRRKPSRLKPVRWLNQLIDSRAVAAAPLKLYRDHPFDYLLMDCFREYFSPFWVPKLRRLRREGVVSGVVSHDPVRDFVVGPKAWHRYCIRQAYSVFDDVFVHDAGEIDFGGGKPDCVRIHQIPHGPYAYTAQPRPREAVRRELGLGDGDLVMLAFGQIRDGKNLDACIRALKDLPERVKLLVAGKADSNSQKGAGFYRSLAEELGVENRCAWQIRYIENAEIPDLFSASDIVLLTYSKAFVSASGVFNTAMQFERPVIAAGGDGPMRKAVCQYHTGRWVDDPTPGAIAMAAMELDPPAGVSGFADYRRDHSWETNARIVKQAVSARLPQASPAS
jgi:glycosyltransferase involved in cell wall biosynthesis